MNTKLTLSLSKEVIEEAKEYAKAHPDEQFYAVTGVRGEEDFIDLKANK